MLPFVSHGQQTQAPVYKDGDWWRVKVEVVQKGYSRSGQCDENYPEYLVRWEQGNPKVYGVSGKNEEEINCPSVIRDLLNIPPDEMGWLSFPLSLNSAWSFRYQRRIPGVRSWWADTQNKVVAWEKVRTPKGEFDSFKIERVLLGDPETLYYSWYSPVAKAIIVFQRRATLSDRTVTLVDFNVSD
jgi:hypothetical protein